MSSDSTIVRRRSSFFSPSPSPPQADTKEILAFASDNRHFSLIRNLHLADVITLFNALCGFMSVISSVRYAMSNYTQSHYILRAMALVPLGLFFDFMDGRVARWRNKSSLMGQELDSLADLISFGLAPAICAFTLGLQTTMDTILLGVFVLCGLTRLARFNVTVVNIPKDAGGKAKYFEGTPIPTTLILVIATFICWTQGKVHDQIIGGKIFEDTPLVMHPVVLVFILSGSAMISKSLKVPKI